MSKDSQSSLREKQQNNNKPEKKQEVELMPEAELPSNWKVIFGILTLIGAARANSAQKGRREVLLQFN